MKEFKWMEACIASKHIEERNTSVQLKINQERVQSAMTYFPAEAGMGQRGYQIMAGWPATTECKIGLPATL